MQQSRWHRRGPSKKSCMHPHWHRRQLPSSRRPFRRRASVGRRASVRRPRSSPLPRREQPRRRSTAALHRMRTRKPSRVFDSAVGARERRRTPQRRATRQLLPCCWRRPRTRAVRHQVPPTSRTQPATNDVRTCVSGATPQARDHPSIEPVPDRAGGHRHHCGRDCSRRGCCRLHSSFCRSSHWVSLLVPVPPLLVLFPCSFDDTIRRG